MLECHSCGAELTIADRSLELELKDFNMCPVCGSENIVTSEK